MEISPVSPIPKKAEVERISSFIVFTKDDIGRVFSTFNEAMSVAEDAAKQHGKTMLVFEQVGGYVAETQTKLRKL